MPVTKLTKKSMLTGNISSRMIAASSQDIQNWLHQNATGCAPLIQEAFPDLSADDREFILTGTTPEEWNTTFPDE